MAKPAWTVDQIVDNLNRNGEFWQGDTITYSFPETYPVEYIGTGFDFEPFTDRQKYLAERALQAWDDVIAVSLEETLGPDSDIRIGGSRSFEVAGSSLPGTVVDGRDFGGDVWVHPYNVLTNTNSHPGSAGYSTLVHEIGHALGFEHPGEYNSLTSPSFSYDNDAEYRQDSMQYTVMSYFNADETGSDHTPNYFTDGIPTTQGYKYASTPLLHDIAAAQAVYGADMTTRTGDTVYGFNSNSDRAAFEFESGIGTRGSGYPVVAIWDAGGNDTLDFSGFTGATTLSLGAGSFSSTQYMTNNVAIAFGVEIENGIGGSGDDLILGNNLDNVLEGRDGNDTIAGLGGNDSITGGAGFDTIIGHDGNDILFGGDGADLLAGGANDDTLEGGEGDDTVLGDDGVDLLSGGLGDDVLDGGAGANDVAVFSGNRADYDVSRDFRGNFTIVDLSAADGDEGTDSLFNVEWFKFSDQTLAADSFAIPAPPDLVISGTEANDALSGDLGNDTLYGLGANDLLRGLEGDDLLEGGSGNDRLLGYDGDDTLHGDEGNDILSGGFGNDVLEGGAGDDDLYGWQGDDTLRGGDGNDSVSGGTGSNLLFGDAGNDTIVGHAGTDTMYGGEGADTLTASSGNDFLQGDEGNDTLLGGFGEDELFGGADDDSLLGGNGSDSLTGGAGNDWHDGGEGDDVVAFNGPRSDYGIARDHTGVIIVTDLNTVNGDEGEDRIALSVEWLKFADQQISTSSSEIPEAQGLVVTGSDASEVIEGGLGADSLYGLAGEDRIYGRAGDDVLDGGRSNDVLDGGKGDDVLFGGAANDRIIGGDGLDTAVFGGLRDEYEITFSAGVATVRYLGLNGGALGGTDTVAADVEQFAFSDGVWAVNDLPANIPPPAAPVFKISPSRGGPLHGNTGDDTLLGRNGHDTFFGYEGQDLLFGGAGNDSLYGADGVDTLLGDKGKDLIYGGDDTDFIHGGADADRIYGENGDDVIIGHKGNDQLYGGEGSDIITGDKGNDVAYGGLGADVISGGKDKDRVYGEDGDDLLNGGKGNDQVFGDDGNDTVIGGKGNDLVRGGADNDTVIGGKGNDQVYGDDGADYIDAGKGNDRAFGGAEDDTMIGGKGKDNLLGGSGDDYIEGGKHNDRLYGEEGNDTIDGGKHNDRIYGGDGNDTMDGGKGKDRVFGGDGDDTYIVDGKDRIFEAENEGTDTVLAGFNYRLGANFENLDLIGAGNISGTGNALNNYLWGNEGHNRLYAGDGEDTLDGWLGNDLMVGGEDSDVFLFGLGEDEGQDIILDFNRSEDVLAFDNVIDGAGDDLADIDAQILSIINEGDGGDVVVSFASGTDVTFNDLGSGAAGTLGSIGDLVDDASTQISLASAAGISAGSVLVNLVIDPSDYIVEI